MEQANSYTIFEKNDLNEAYDFLRSINLLDNMEFDSWVKYCDWAYWNNPYRENKPAGFLIKESENIIAFISRIYVPFRIDTWQGTAALNDYTGVAPEYRGFTGLMFISNILKKEDIPVTYSPHTNKAIHQIWKNLGAKFWSLSDQTWVYRLSRFKSTLSRYTLLRNCLPNFLINIISNLEFQFNKKFKLPRIQYSVETTQIFELKLKSQINTLWKLAKNTIDIGVIRDFDYLSWRYSFNNHKNHYLLFMKDQHGHLVGLSVLTYEPKSGMALIAEFLHNPNIENCAEQLLAATFNFSKKTLGSTVIASKIVSESLIDLWAQSGFTQARKSHPQYGIISKHLDTLTEDMNIMMTYGEYKI